MFFFLIADSLGVIDEAHMLLENLPRKKDESIPQDIDCFLCRKMGKELKTIYSCIKGRKGFHISCFAAFHYRGTLSSPHKATLDVVFKSDVNPTIGLPSKHAASDTSKLKLPAEKETSHPKAFVRALASKIRNEQRKCKKITFLIFPYN